MTNRIEVTMLLAGVGCILALASAVHAAAGDKAAQAQEKVEVVILVGGHGYHKDNFDKLWSSHDDIRCDIWKGSPYSVLDDVSQFKHDVILMYNLPSGITATQKQNLLKLLEKGVGLVVWHHALANCQDWPEFERIAGAKFWLRPGERNGVQIPRSGTGGGRLKMHIEEPNHPVTKGITDFEIEDETYNRQTFCDDIRVLVSTDHPRSDKPIAWVHDYGKARVFGYQSGHDAKVWTNESFRRLMARGIRWVAGCLPGGEK